MAPPFVVAALDKTFYSSDGTKRTQKSRATTMCASFSEPSIGRTKQSLGLTRTACKGELAGRALQGI